LVDAMLKRLGVPAIGGDADRELVAALITALGSKEAEIDRVCFDWRGGRDPGAERYPSGPFRALAAALEGRSQAHDHPYWSGDGPCSMHIEEVEEIWSAIAERDDWKPFEDKITAIRRMGEAMERDARAA
jgi:hypothetical protein